MPSLKRRHFILGALSAAGALVVGWSAAPARQRLLTGAALAVVPGQVALNGWVKVAADNSVTVMMSQAEMGQGAHTGLAMLLAEEMDLAWEQVRLEQSGDDGIYNNQSMIVDALPFAPEDQGMAKRAATHLAGKIIRELPGMQGTGGSSSIKDQWLPLRQAGASARAMLIAAAAKQWQVEPAQCRTIDGHVLHASGRRASYGELAAGAARLALPASAPLKKAADFTLIGKPVRRLDNAAKLDGSAAYGIDALPDGLLYASIQMCPTLGGKVLRFDAAAARKLPGVRKVVAVAPMAGGLGTVGLTSGGVAVIADTPYQAQRALRLVTVEWEHGAAAGLSSAAVMDTLVNSLEDGDAKPHQRRGDATAALASAARVIEAEYRVPFLAHAAMEPMNCTAQFTNGGATLWVGTQAAGITRRAVAGALGIDTEKVTVHVPFLGGGFGRRYMNDCVLQAVALSRETGGRPVQLLWSREQDMAHDFYRPAYAARYRAGFDAQGRLTAWLAVSAGSSLGAPGMLDGTVQGAADTPYLFPAVRVSHRTVDSPVPVGFWRSVAHSQNAFFTESFIDECAAAAGRDPVALRAGLLGHDARHLRVLRRAAELSGWDQPTPPGPDGARHARGIAMHRSFGSIVAHVVELSIGVADQIAVRRVVCVIDCGQAVNPNLVRQQMESAIVFGLSAALHGEITVAGGQVQQSNFHDYAPLRIDRCPRIEVDIIDSDAHPGGVGESGTPPIAPALANALFALTGRRLRTLPLKLA